MLTGELCGFGNGQAAGPNDYWGARANPLPAGTKVSSSVFGLWLSALAQLRGGWEIEFDLQEIKSLKERRRLLSMAGGHLAAVRMSAQERKQRAMKAANERYKNLKQFEKKADDGSVVKCRAEHVEGRCWVVICTLDDKEFFRRECGSRREVDAAFSSGETLLEFKNYLYAQSTSK